MTGETNRLVEKGERALLAGDWVEARDAFRIALRDAETPEAFNGLGEALWWLGATQDSISARERAYAGFRRAQDQAHAADVALTLSVHYRANVGNAAASAGWLARAARLINDFGLEDMRGWLLLMQAYEADPVSSEGLAREAKEHASRSGDLDLELCALSQLGSALVSQGRLKEGLPLLDEAMAGSLSGEGGAIGTIVFTSCNMIGSCVRCADFERAVAWIQAADRFIRGYGCPFLFVYCRALYGGVLIASGDWVQAEEELRIAVAESKQSQAAVHVAALATLATLRLAQGRLDDAEGLISGIEEQSAAIHARLHLAQGRAAAAAAAARRALDSTSANQLDAALLEELLGEAEIALGDASTAAARGKELIKVGLALECPIISARGERLVGRAKPSRRHLDVAVSEFTRLGMPYEAARARLMLAEVVRALEPQVSEAEARTALSAFEILGAERDADAATALLRELGVKAARAGPKNLGTLTKRETKVLELLGQGLSNPEIAQRLYVSRKTVEHHVAHILSKLGLRNRTEAAAAIALVGSVEDVSVVAHVQHTNEMSGVSDERDTS
jgi:ATP/maltotriose-dependent transcriptional regulator MalT